MTTLSRLGLGTWQTFERIDDRATLASIVRTALENGVGFFDTADSYADGIVETRLAQCLEGISKDRFFVATKTFFPLPSQAGDGGGLSSKRLRWALERSLQRLRTDCIDLYQCHRFDPKVPLTEIVESMAAFAREGKIRHWGVCRWESDQLESVAAICKSLGAPPPFAQQYHLNLLTRGVLEQVFPLGRRLGLQNIVYSPLAQGVLTGKYSEHELEAQSFKESERAFYSSATMWDLKTEKLKRIQDWSKRVRAEGFEPSQVALRWCLTRPSVDCVLLGASNASQLENNLQALQIKINQNHLEDLCDAL